MVISQGTLSNLGLSLAQSGAMLAAPGVVAYSPFLAAPSTDVSASSYTSSERLTAAESSWNVADVFEPAIQFAAGAKDESLFVTYEMPLAASTAEYVNVSENFPVTAFQTVSFVPGVVAANFFSTTEQIPVIVLTEGEQVQVKEEAKDIEGKNCKSDDQMSLSPHPVPLPEGEGLEKQPTLPEGEGQGEGRETIQATPLSVTPIDITNVQTIAFEDFVKASEASFEGPLSHHVNVVHSRPLRQGVSASSGSGNLVNGLDLRLRGDDNPGHSGMTDKISGNDGTISSGKLTRNDVPISASYAAQNQDGEENKLENVRPGVMCPGLHQSFLGRMHGEHGVAGNFPATILSKRVEAKLRASDPSIVKTANNVPEKVYVQGQVEGRSALALYVRVGDEYVFSGWKETGVVSTYIRPDAARVEKYDYSLSRVLGLGMPGGESSPNPDILEEENARLERAFVTMLLTQIRRGPDSLSGDTLRHNFNSMVERSFHPGVAKAIAVSDWSLFIQEAFRLAVMYSGAFGDNGIRSKEDIEASAADMLGIDAETFVAWKNHFAFSPIDNQVKMFLHLFFKRPRRSDLNPALVSALETELSASFSGQKYKVSPIELAYTEWIILALSSIEDAGAKSDEVEKFVEAQFNKGAWPIAGLALALVVMHSEFSRQKENSDHVKLWTKKDVEDLFGKLLARGEVGLMVSHHLFRDLIDLSLQGALNSAALNANYLNPLNVINQIDVTKPGGVEEYWNALYETGQEESLMMDVLSRMATNGLALN